MLQSKNLQDENPEDFFVYTLKYLEKIKVYTIGRCLSLMKIKVKKTIWAAIIFGAAAFIISNHAIAEEEEGKDLAEDALSAFVMEAETGQVLYHKNEEEKLPPASMTKIMTLLLTMEALDEGQIKLDEEVRASERAASMGGSQIFLEEGEMMTVDELLKGIAIASGNDASVAMAEHIAGTEEKFIKKMNEKAEELNLKHTKFQNTTGLPADDHYTTAKDLAIISQALLQHEKVLEYTGKYEDYLRQGEDNEFWLVNTNRLVKHYDGVDGLKTGYTNEAKYNLTATAKKDNMRVITVLMGAGTPKERNQFTASLLDYAFQNHDYHILAEKGEKMGDVKVEKGRETTVEAVLAENAAVVLPKGKSADDITQKVNMKKTVTAPAKAEDLVGTLQIYENEELLSETELVLKKDAAPADWPSLFKRTLFRMTGKVS